MIPVRFSALMEVSIHNHCLANGRGYLAALGGEYTALGSHWDNTYIANFKGPNGSVSVIVDEATLTVDDAKFQGDTSSFVDSLDTLQRAALLNDTWKLQHKDKELRSK